MKTDDELFNAMARDPLNRAAWWIVRHLPERVVRFMAEQLTGAVSDETWGEVWNAIRSAR